MTGEANTGFAGRYGALLARLLFAPILIGYAFLKVRALMGSVQADALQNFPMTQVLLYLTIGLELVGGVLIVVGFRTRLAAVVLAVFFLGVTALMVPLLGAAGGMGATYLDQIVKNLAFIGGLVLLALHGPGPISIDHRRLRMR
ncbi:MAG: DoxX family protein [Proteobacteria bacterium]|nr:DoxX family protein [Burkholderiales bacterium]